MATIVNDSNFEEVVLNSAQPVLVDFWAEWCGPCKMMLPIVEELAGEYAEKLTVVKMSVLTLQENMVSGIFLLFYSSKEAQLLTNKWVLFLKLPWLLKSTN